MNTQMPELAISATVGDCKRFIRELVSWIGPGFHPDTNFHDYVDGSYNRIFNHDEANVLNDALNRTIGILNSAGIDPCAIGLPEQRRLLAGSRSS